MTTQAGPEKEAQEHQIDTPDDELGPLREIAAREHRFSKARADSIIPTAGHEGAIIAPRLYKGETIAVYTSGGDASGKSFKFFYILFQRERGLFKYIV